MYTKALTVLSLASTSLAFPYDRRADSNSSCTALPLGSGPVPSPDTAEAFLADPFFALSAQSAKTPDGYNSSFTNLNASSKAAGYIGYTTLESYNVNTCASACTKLNGCAAFNIYFERSPTVSPASSCPNPASTTTIKCVFWGSPVTESNASNNGQYSENFHTVIAGSNGYTSNKVITSLPGYNTSTAYGLSALQVPADCTGSSTFLRSATFNGTTSDPSLCAKACDDFNTYAFARSGNTTTPITCDFFDSYLLSKNDVPQYMQCALYSAAWDAEYATNGGQFQGDDKISVSWSFGFKRDGGKDACVASSDAKAATNATTTAVTMSTSTVFSTFTLFSTVSSSSSSDSVTATADSFSPSTTVAALS